MTKPRVPAAKEGIPSERAASETTALLVELGRAVKARSFYAATEPEVRLLFSRAWRSFQADLRRHGALDIEAAPAWLRVPGLALRIPNVQLGGLPQRMADRGVRTLRFDTDLTSDAFGSLVDLLAGEAEDSPEAFAEILYRRVPRGIVVNGTPPASAAAPAETAPSVDVSDVVAPPPIEVAPPPVAAAPPAVVMTPPPVEIPPPPPPMPPAPAPVVAAPPPAPAPIPELSLAELSIPDAPPAPSAPPRAPEPPVDDLFELGPQAFAAGGTRTGPMTPPPPTIPIAFHEEGEGDWSLGGGAPPGAAEPTLPLQSCHYDFDAA
jgi:hypothetical protein